MSVEFVGARAGRSAGRAREPVFTWLARVLADGGRTAEARAVFENAVSHVSDVGLLAEEIDSATGEQLGNFPQAFSHVGLVNAAWAISQAEDFDSAVQGQSGRAKA